MSKHPRPTFYGVSTIPLMGLMPEPRQTGFEAVLDVSTGTGIKLDVRMPFAFTITSVTLLADQSGSVVVDIWKDTYANFPPTVADTICASALPTLSGVDHSQDTTLVGWTTLLAKGDVLRFNVQSVTTCQRVAVSIDGTRLSQ